MVTHIDPVRQIKKRWTFKEKLFLLLTIIFGVVSIAGLLATIRYGQKASEAENKAAKLNQVNSQVSNKAEQIYQYVINIQGDPTFNNLPIATQDTVQIIGKLSADVASLMNPDPS